MQNWYRIKKKRVVYGMIVLLFVNLFSGSWEGYVVFAENMMDGTMLQTAPNPLIYTADCKTGNATVNAEGVSVVYSKDKVVIEYEIETDGVYTELHSRVESKNDSGKVDGTVKKDTALVLAKGKDSFHKTAEECFEIGKNNFLEGAYTLTYWLQDASGEHKLEEKTVDFILDETKPVITTMLEEKDVTADGVTGHQVIYKIDSTEINYETCDITVYVARKTMEGEMEAKPYLTYRPEKAADFEKTITFTEDGIYEVYVKAGAAAGNEAS